MSDIKDIKGIQQKAAGRILGAAFLAWLGRIDLPRAKSKSARRKEAAIRLTLSPFVVKVGRNDPCPCKSGKKFKKCCAAKAA